jgi:putative transposase
MPMQVLEIDNSELDVLQVDSEERELLKAPDLTSAIDNYSRMIAGTEISFFSCSSRSVLEVLVQSILPKDNYCQTYNTDQEWPIQGFPVVILVDNGMDFRSKAVQEFCRKYDIIIEYVPLRNPQYKAFIEQWFNVLHKALESEEVPGTRPILRKRLENPDLKPEADAVFTLQESETWLYKWIINEYHFDNSYDDHVLAPYLKLVDAQEGRTPLILPLPREPPTNKREIELLHLATLTTESRQLGAAGVVWEHLKYNNEELALLFKRVGEKQEVKILLDTRDIRNIWVVDPITEKPIKVGLASGWAQKIANIYGDTPINASAWKKQVAQIKEITKERITPFLYGKMESKLQRKELIKSSKKTTKFIRKEREQQKEAIRKGIINKVLDNKDSDSIITNFTQSKEIEIESNQTNEFQQIDWSKIVPTGKRTRKAY